MSRFFLLLWLKWAVRLTLCSTFFAVLFSSFITLFIYFLRGMPSLNSEIYVALFDIFKFWFPILWSLTILLAEFRGIKYLFNRCINKFELKLLTCRGDEALQTIGYGDVLRIWRKWLMLNVWIIASFMIFALVYTNLFTSYNGVFEWFNFYWLYAFILLSGFFSIVLMGLKCKKVKIATC